MSGHSRWAGIKHKKAAIDSKRGKIFTKIIREITIAAKSGGSNLESNARLRKAVEDAKAANMPADNIKKGIQRGTGELPGVIYEEVMYEGYGPSGVAVMLDGTTDNKNRTSSEIRRIFAKHGGNLGEVGCVGWMFQKKGYINVLKTSIDEEKIMNLAISAGADDVSSEDEEVYEIFTTVNEFEKVKKYIEENKIKIESAEITYIPNTYIPLSGSQADKMLSLMEELEDNDDVKNVYANFDIKK